MLQYDFYASPLGPLRLTGKDGILTGLEFWENMENTIPSGSFAPVKKWLDAYFRAEAPEPDFLMDPAGTAFQKLIWELLLDTPVGQTRTYGDLAREAADILGKKTMSAQAVGQAVGRNPIAIIVPCHRVIGAGGNLTGYAYGVDRKAWLLEHEQKQEEMGCVTQTSDILKQNG